MKNIKGFTLPTQPNYYVKHSVTTTEDVWQGQKNVHHTEYRYCKLEKVAIDWSVQKIRGTVYFRTWSEHYDAKTGALNYTHPQPEKWQKNFIHFPFEEAAKYLEIV